MNSFISPFVMLVALALSIMWIPSCHAGEMYLVSRQQGEITWWHGQAQAPRQVPLGSLWKLFVYVYAVEHQLQEPTYHCQTQQTAAIDDEYCCTQPESLHRDTALARSCGPYFAPQRLGITPSAWRSFWEKQAPSIPWLLDLKQIKPTTLTSIPDLLMALDAVSLPSRQMAREALLHRLLQPAWSDVLRTIGSGYRFKTFTWYHPNRPKTYLGGGAGWLANGQSFWLGGVGGSHRVWAEYGDIVHQKITLPPPPSQAGCVRVHYFYRYPIQRVLDRHGAVASSGTLRGDYVVQFQSGQSLRLRSLGEMTLMNQKTSEASRSLGSSGSSWRITAQLGLEDYVARVIDREGQASFVQASRALAVAARSYLFQNGRYHQGCWHINDDSRQQRVAPHPPTPQAQAVVAFTEGLRLTGSPIFYHQSQHQPNTLNWQAAVAADAQGRSFDTLLREAYPQASWQRPDASAQCPPLADVQRYWLDHWPVVRRYLAPKVSGLGSISGLQICRLDYGHPFSDHRTQRIYLHRWKNEQDHITLWHETLHLALAHHPLGQDETWVENTAQAITLHLTQGAAFDRSQNREKRIRHAQ